MIVGSFFFTSGRISERASSLRSSNRLARATLPSALIGRVAVTGAVPSLVPAVVVVLAPWEAGGGMEGFFLLLRLTVGAMLAGMRGLLAQCGALSPLRQTK